MTAACLTFSGNNFKHNHDEKQILPYLGAEKWNDRNESREIWTAMQLENNVTGVQNRDSYFICNRPSTNPSMICFNDYLMFT